jgi:uncharacterized protein (TIGR02646 family)
MIFIEKIPDSEAKNALSKFIQKQKSAGANLHYKYFQQSDGKGLVQNSLLKEQYYLCAYCMRRIHTAEKIEHWSSQEESKNSNNAIETLDYRNMLAVCEGTSGSHNHCDQSRSLKNPTLTVNPTKKEIIQQVKYLKNGKIYSENSMINNDLNSPDVLNLNNISLMDERKKAYEAVKKSIDIKLEENQKVRLKQ